MCECMCLNQNHRKGIKKQIYFFTLLAFAGNICSCELVRNYFISLRLVMLLIRQLLIAGCYSHESARTPYFSCALHAKENMETPRNLQTVYFFL